MRWTLLAACAAIAATLWLPGEAAQPAARRKARLEQIKAYYDWLAGLSEADRDSRFRERFDRIDANHDGRIDAGERAAWRDKQRAFYRRDRATAHPAAEEAAQ